MTDTASFYGEGISCAFVGIFSVPVVTVAAVHADKKKDKATLLRNFFFRLFRSASLARGGFLSSIREETKDLSDGQPDRHCVQTFSSVAVAILRSNDGQLRLTIICLDIDVQYFVCLRS